MSSISQKPTSIDNAGTVGQSSLETVDSPADSVKRGFSNQNSVSHTEGKNEARLQTSKPVLDKPTDSASSERVISNVIKQYDKEQQDKAGKSPEAIKEAIVQQQKTIPLRKQSAALQGKKAELESMGFEPKQIDDLLSVANPNDSNNKLSTMHSTTARLNDLDETTGQSKLNQLFDGFEDVIIRVSSITDIPDDLRADLAGSLEKFSKTALNGQQHLDVDSATTMLVEIQSKLQNERIKFDQENIKLGQIAAEQRSSTVISKIRDSIEKVEKAKKTQLIGKIFGYIALAFMAVATVIVGVVGVVFTGGALTMIAIGCMLAAMTLMVVMIASSETNNFMMTIFDDLAGDDKKNARIAAMVVWATIMIALTAGAAVFGGLAGAGGAAASTASAATSATATGTSTAATVTATGANTAASAASTAAKITAVLTKLAKLAQVIGGTAQVASGSSDVATSVYNYQADMLRADSLEEKAKMSRIQKMIDDAIESIEKVIEELQSGYSTAANIIKADHETKTTLSRNLRA